MSNSLSCMAAAAAVLAVACSQGAGDGAIPVDAEIAAESVVVSADGTPIGYARVGRGPIPIVIVHGVLDSGEAWMPVAEALAETCSCFVIDRRGRGRSGDGDAYSFEREVEDIEAVLRAAGPAAVLVAHSSGAIYALEAARRAPMAALVVYEPPLRAQGFERAVDEMRQLVTDGKLDDAAAVFFTREAGMSDSALAEFRRTPVWPQIAALAPTLVREWEAIFAFAPTVERYAGLSMPTLLLTGSQNVDDPKFATVDLASALSGARIEVLEGEGHTANESVPALVASRIADFLRSAVPR